MEILIISTLGFPNLSWLFLALAHLGFGSFCLEFLLLFPLEEVLPSFVIVYLRETLLCYSIFVYQCSIISNLKCGYFSYLAPIQI